MTDKKSSPSASHRSEPAMAEQPRQAESQQQQSEVNQADQRTVPVRRPLFRT